MLFFKFVLVKQLFICIYPCQIEYKRHKLAKKHHLSVSLSRIWSCVHLSIVICCQYGVVLIWGVPKDGRSESAERLLPGLCFNRLVMHSMAFTVTIVLHGACDDIGKVYIGTTTTSLREYEYSW